MRPVYGTAVFRASFTSLVGAMVLLSVTASTLDAARKKQEKKETPEYGVSGRDPKAFRDAEAMFAAPKPPVLEDRTGGAILAELARSLRGSTPWSTEMWRQLDRLRGTRLSSQLVRDLQTTARNMTVSTRKASRSANSTAKSAFSQGNRYYELGKFKDASSSYRRALNTVPNYWDAWNNLALAEMHAGNDVVALFLLSALTRNNPKYAGASINASVCSMRLGEDETAYNIAANLANKHSQMPMAQYNLAWFENARGDLDASQSRNAKAISQMPDYKIAKWLKSINAMESGHRPGSDEWKALPLSDRSHGIPSIPTKTVSASTATAYFGKNVATKLPKGTEIVISERRGDWYAFYWSSGNRKRRLWVRESSLGSQVRVSVPRARIMFGKQVRGTVSRGQTMTATAERGSWIWIDSVKGSPHLQGWIKKSEITGLSSS